MVLTTAGLSLIPAGFAGSSKEADERPGKDYTVQNIIDLLLKPVEGAPFPKTVDTLKSGSPAQKVTGIVTTMFATIPIIREANKLGANFIIVHEPTFYNHTDDHEWAGSNRMVAEKEQLLNQLKIAVWRFHDYWHAYRPDGIRYGVLQALGWEKLYNDEEEIVNLPAISLIDLVAQVKSKLGIEHVRIIGNPSQPCRRIALLPGAAGGQAQMKMIEKSEPDVFICGEIHEWETGEYMRDKNNSGKPGALIVLGHAQSEEPGMKYLAEMLQPLLPSVSVTHIPSGNPFRWV